MQAVSLLSCDGGGMEAADLADGTRRHRPEAMGVPPPGPWAMGPVRRIHSRNKRRPTRRRPGVLIRSPSSVTHARDLK